jgi:hypothetical protein
LLPGLPGFMLLTKHEGHSLRHIPLTTSIIMHYIASTMIIHSILRKVK